MGSLIDNTLGTNIFGSNAYQNASAAQQAAVNQANQTLKDQLAYQQDQYKPYSAAGLTGLQALQDPTLGMGNFQGDPGYQFRLQQGEQGINNSLAARGLANSGAALKALNQYNQNFATNEYQNAYNRAFNRVSALTGIGQNATQGLVNASQNYGNQISNNAIGLGNAMAASQMGQAHAQSGLLGSALTAGAMYAMA